MITIDGSAGEGGGQILRTALGLSLCTGQPFRITRIRARRKKPGLLRQHLTAVRAATQVGNATVSGDEMGSGELTFAPDMVTPGNYTFAVGTAGSATLVLQTVLPALILAPAASTVICQGGTHNPFAPSTDFLNHCFAPMIERAGGGLQVKTNQVGFYPAGGGQLTARIQSMLRFAPLRILERGELVGYRAHIWTVGLPRHVFERELAALRRKLTWPDRAFLSLDDFDPVTGLPMGPTANAPGQGNAISLIAEYENVTEVVTSLGERGLKAETVADRAVDALRRYQTSDAVVGEYLADQLLIPMALAGAGEFITGRPSLHSTTNAETIARFLEVKIAFEPVSGTQWRCVVGDG